MEPIVDFTLTLNGSGTADDIRAAFTSIVNALRDENRELAGTLTVDGIPYEVADVPAAEDTEEDSAEETDQTDQTDEAEEAVEDEQG